MNLSLASQVRLTFFKLPEKRKITLKRSLIRKIMQTGFVSAILFITTSLQLLFGSPLKSQTIDDVKIHIGLNNETLVQAFHKIEAHTSFRFMYRKDEVQNIRNLDVKPGDRTVGQLLRTILSGTSLTYRQVNNQVLIMPSEGSRSLYSTNLISSPRMPEYIPKANIVKGRVTNAQGEPLAGVSVTIKGTQTGTLTDENGNYSLDVPATGTLVFSFVGFTAQEVSVNGRSNIDISLVGSASELEQVVVVGYGTQKKVNLTGAVSVVKGDELADRPVVNATQSLQGLVPGLNVGIGNKGGTPGTSYDLNIRGQGNLSGTDKPYILVDGMEMSLSDVNPNDIESISVLKDAAASSIYGARAAYGVILVTTKKGSKGKTSFNYNGNVGFTRPIKMPDMVNGYEYAKFFNDGWKNLNGIVEYSDAKLDLLKQFAENPVGMNQWPEQTSNWFFADNSPLGVGNTNNFKLQYKDYAIRQDHNLSAIGGNDKNQFYVSGGFYDEGGLLRYADIDYKRYNFNARLTSQLSSWLNMNLNTKLSSESSKSPFGDNSIDEDMYFHNLARTRPTNSPYDLNGHFTELSQIPYLLSGTVNDSLNNDLGLLFGFDVHPTKNWSIFLNYNYRINNSNDEQTAIPATEYGLDGTTRFTAREELNVPLAGSYYRAMAKTTYGSFNVYTNYQLIEGLSNLKVMVGGQEDNFRNSFLWGKADALLSFNNPGLGVSSGSRVTDEIRNGWSTLGFFGRINYDYNGIYLLEVNARYDGSSRFNDANKWGFFPSLSFGYNIAKERFMKSVSDVVNTLKVRGSYGFLGNQSGAGLYTFAQTMGTQAQGTWFFPDGREMIIFVPGPFNPNVTWERIQSKDLGVDFALFNNKLAGSFDVYQRITRRMLGPTAKLPDMFGASSPQANNAAMRDRGWEFDITYRNRISENVSYSVGAMVSDYKAVILDYENPTFNDPVNSWYKGKLVGEIWGYRTDGLLQNQGSADKYNDLDLSFLSGRKWVPGDVAYRDLNGDSKVNNGTNKLGDMGDMTIIGNTTPRYQFSFNGSISWKRLTLSMLWQGVGKRNYLPANNNVYFWGAGTRAQVTVFKEHMDYWRPDNLDAYYPNPYIGTVGTWPSYTAKVSSPSDRYLLSAAYLRLKNLTINYRMPDNIVSKIGLQRVDWFVAGENLITITKMPRMFDPETVFSFFQGGKNYLLTQVFSLGLRASL